MTTNVAEAVSHSKDIFGKKDKGKFKASMSHKVVSELNIELGPDYRSVKIPDQTRVSTAKGSRSYLSVNRPKQQIKHLHIWEEEAGMLREVTDNGDGSITVILTATRSICLLLPDNLKHILDGRKGSEIRILRTDIEEKQYCIHELPDIEMGSRDPNMI